MPPPRAIAACAVSMLLVRAVPTPPDAAVVIQPANQPAADALTGQAELFTNPGVANKITNYDSPAEYFSRGIAWHKSGSVMMKESLDANNEYLASLLQDGAVESAPGVADPAVDMRVGVLADSGNGITLGEGGVAVGGYNSFDGFPRSPRPPPAARFFVIYRNPIEMAVSELAYDQGNPPLIERYTWQFPLDPEGMAKCYKMYCSAPQYCGGLQSVLAASETYLNGVLPAPSGDTWHGYLNRLLDGGMEDEALIATAIFMLEVSLTNGAQFATYQRDVRPDTERSCEADYDDADFASCLQVWRSMFGSLVNRTSGAAPSIAGVVPSTSGPFRGNFSLLMDELVVRAANASCPAVAAAAAAHSASDTTNMTQPADRVARLSRLDTQYLNGTLAERADAVGCAMSARYQPAQRRSLQ